MAFVKPNEQINKSAAIIKATIADKWSDILIKDADGKVSLGATKRAFGVAFRSHLKDIGALGGGRPPKRDYDVANVVAGAYFAFIKIAKGNPATCELNALLYATMHEMQVPFGEYDRAKKIVRSCIDSTDSPIKVVGTGKKFDGSRVELKGAPVAPSKFVSWEAMATPLATLAADAPATESTPPVATDADAATEAAPAGDVAADEPKADRKSATRAKAGGKADKKGGKRKAG